MDSTSPAGAAPAQLTYDELGRAHLSGGEIPLGDVLDLSLPVSIELGRTTLTVQEVLGLGRGAVIQLDRQAGQPADIFVGDRRFAEGEVVLLGEHFGIRITRIIPRPNTPQAA
jgi:flagellar motor switch protein FliN/FliY